MRRAIHHPSKCLAVLALVLCAASPAWGWGRIAHQATALAAERMLTPAAREEVSRLLALEGATSLAQVATWADRIRPEQRAGAPRHSTCPERRCLVGQIEDGLATLADRNRSDRERLTALKYLVHFVAEIHMPLHTVPPRLGRVRVTFEGRTDKLHKVWDTRILQQQGVSAQSLAEQILRSGVRGSGGSAAGWAQESRQLARSLIQPTSRQAMASDTPLPLGEDYGRENYPVIVDRLSKAGARLAGALNSALR